MSIKLTPEILREMVLSERDRLMGEAQNTAKQTNMRKKTINDKISYLNKLKIKEADLKKRLNLIEKTRSLLKTKVTEEL